MFDPVQTTENNKTSEYEVLANSQIVDIDWYLRNRRTRQQKLIAKLPRHIENNELDLYYQPQIDLRTGKTLSVEALVRWQDRFAGTIAPHMFVPLAEQCGHIIKLTDWVIDNSLRQLSKWKSRGVELDVAVNLSVCNFDDYSLPVKISRFLDKWSIPARRLILEVTEGVMIKNMDQAIKILLELSNQGIKLSLDDFGSGYSSLSYLSTLPISELKIDRSLVMDMDKNYKNRTIVQSTIELAKRLGLGVVAEGVENISTYNILTLFNCDTAQGFYFCKPVRSEVITSWLFESDWGMLPRGRTNVQKGQSRNVS